MGGTVHAGAQAPGWADLRAAVLAAVTECEAAVAVLRDGAAARAAERAAAAVRDLGAQVTRLAWDEDAAELWAARQFDAGFAAGLAARHRAAVPRPRGPRPPWPRAVS